MIAACAGRFWFARGTESGLQVRPPTTLFSISYRHMNSPRHAVGGTLAAFLSRL